jgi:hypothetical protein
MEISIKKKEKKSKRDATDGLSFVTDSLGRTMAVLIERPGHAGGC